MQWQRLAFQNFAGGVNNVSPIPGDNQLGECENYDIKTVGGTLESRKGYTVESLYTLGYYVMEDCMATTGWSVSTDGANLAIDSVNYLLGSSSMNFDKTGTTEAYVYAVKTTTDDYSYYQGISVYVKFPAVATSVTLFVYTDAYNYYYQTTSITGTDWNKVYLWYDQAGTVGSPSLSNTTSIKVQFNTAAAADTGTDFIIDKIVAENPAVVVWAGDMVTTTDDKYYFAIADGGVWLRNGTTILGKYVYENIYDGFTIGGEACGTVFKDAIYFTCEGCPAAVFQDGAVSEVGIDPPDAPAFVSYSAGGDLTSDNYSYFMSYYSTAYAHESSRSNFLENVAPNAENVNLKLCAPCPNLAYDKKRLYRNTNGTNYFMIEEFDSNIETYTDSTDNLEVANALSWDAEYNHPMPDGIIYLRVLKDRLIGVAKDGKIYYSRWGDGRSWSPYNVISVFSGDSNKFVAISAPLDIYMSLFTEDSRYLLTYVGTEGLTYSTGDIHPYTISIQNTKRGCTSHWTQDVGEAGSFWLSEDGVYNWSIGAAEQKISGSVNWFDGINKKYQHRARAKLVGDYYFISIPEGDSTTCSRTFAFNWRLGSWSSHTLALDFIFMREDDNGTNILYHSAERGAITYQYGYNDNGNSIPVKIDTGWKIGGAMGNRLYPRRIQILNNISEESLTLSQFFDDSTTAYTYASEDNSQTKNLISKVLAFNLAGAGNTFKIQAEANTNTVPVTIDGYVIEFVIGTTQ